MTVKIDIVSEYKDKGAKAAEKSMARLQKSAKNLAVALGVGFSINKIVQFGKASVAEFEASEIAATKLQNVLKNTGQLLAFPDTLTGLNNLSKLSGVADDMLTPAFQQLYLATGNANLAMKNLDLAINVSRGSSNDLNTVVDALSKGYMGNTKGLAALNLGLNKAYLATGDMAGVTEQLNNQFKGASAAYLDTYSGKIQILRNDFEDMKQTVGQGLIMAAQAATGNQGIGGISIAMENLGYAISGAAIRLGQFVNLLKDLPIYGKFLSGVIDGWSKLLGIDEIRMEMKNEEWRRNTKLLEQAYAQAEAQKKAAADYAKFLAKQKAAAAAAAKKEQDLAKLKKAGTLMDMDRIQIIAALQGKITEEEKLRLQLQFALITENASEADRLSNELAKTQIQTTNLAAAIANLPPALNPFADFPKWIQDAINEINKLKVAQSSVTPTVTSGAVSIPSPAAPLSVPSLNVPTAPVSVPSIANPQTSLAGYSAYRAGERASINVTVQGNVISNKDLADTIRMQLLDSSASGSFTMSNRATRGD